MGKKIICDKYEIVGIRKIKLSTGHSAQIGTLRQAYSPDRLYAWRGRHASPKWEATQGAHETEREFVESL